MLLNGVVLEVMQPFMRDLDTPHHGSEIARKQNLNQKTVSNTLNRLEDEGLLKSRTVGKNKEFKISFDDRERTMRFLLTLENARTTQFLDGNPRIKEILNRTKPHFKGIVAVFGSYAKGTQKKDSDLDVLSVGEYDAKKVRETSKLYGTQVNVKNMKPEDFKQALKEKDIFIREVVSNHILIQKIEDYLEHTVRGYYGR